MPHVEHHKMIFNTNYDIISDLLQPVLVDFRS